MSLPSNSKRRPELDSICKEIAVTGEGALAFAVAEADSGDLLGFFGENVTLEEMRETVKGVLSLLHSEAVSKVPRAVDGPSALPQDEVFHDLRLVTATRALFARLSPDGRQLFLLVTQAGVGPGWGWKEIRTAQRRLEATV